jgi:hypothetical protein
MGTQLTATVGSAAFGALLGAAGGHLIDEPVPGQPKNNTGAIAGAIIGTLVGGFLGYEGSSPAAAVAGAGGIPRGVGNHFKQGYVPPPPQGGAPGLSGQPQRRVARGGAVNSQLSPARGVGNHFAKAATPPPAPAPRPHWHCDMTQNPPHCWWE